MPRLDTTEKFCKKLLKDLVDIPSVSGEEEKLIAYLERLFSKLGLKARRIPGKARPSNLLEPIGNYNSCRRIRGVRGHNLMPLKGVTGSEATTRGGDPDGSKLRSGATNLLVSIGQGHPFLCLNAHADTVPPAGKSVPHSRVVKNRLYGLGSIDDKGPLAAAICAIKNLGLKRTYLKGRIDLLISIGEERGGGGTELAIRSGYRCKAAVVCESTGFDIGIAQAGPYFIDLKTKGVACHGSKPWQGKNAIFEMMDLVAQIKKVVESRKHSPLIGPPSLNLGAIHGGDIPNRVPDSCSAKLDIRLMPGDNMASFKKAMAKIFKKKRWRSASYSFIHREPMVTDRKNILVKALLRSARRILGHSPRCFGIRGWTEAGNFSSFLNVTSIIFGPGSMNLAHSENEWIDLEEVYQAARIYELFIKEWISII